MTTARRLVAHLAVVLVLLAGGAPAPAALAQGSGPSAYELSAQIQAETQKVAAHAKRKPELEKQRDAHNEKVAAHDDKVAGLDQRGRAHAAKEGPLRQEIAAHNAKPYRFELPRQAAEAAAFDAEAADLRSKEAQFNAEADELQAEKSRLDQEGSQLDAEAQQQRAQAAAFNEEGARLSAECLRLLQQVAAALQAGTGSTAGAPARGGDQSRPARALEQPRRVAGDGGDPVSRRREIEALDAYGKANGVEVDKRQVWARLTPESVSKLRQSATTDLHVTRTYDGLVAKPDSDRYRALVVPSVTDGVTPGQKGFDDDIKAGGHAAAMVDGREIVIDEVATVPATPESAPTTGCGTDCNLVSPGTPTTATVSPRKLLDDAKALQDTVPAARDKYVTVATGQLGGALVYSVNQNGTNAAMRDLAAKLGYRRVLGTDLNRGTDTDAEQILYNAIDEGEELGDGIIAASRPACGPDRRRSGAPGQDCAGRAASYPNIQLWDQPRKR